jgi:hypothetical protein
MAVRSGRLEYRKIEGGVPKRAIGDFCADVAGFGHEAMARWRADRNIWL